MKKEGPVGSDMSNRLAVQSSPVLFVFFTFKNRTNEPDWSEPSVPMYFIGNGVDTRITELGSFTVGGRHVVLPTGMV